MSIHRGTAEAIAIAGGGCYMAGYLGGLVGLAFALIAGVAALWHAPHAEQVATEYLDQLRADARRRTR